MFRIVNVTWLARFIGACLLLSFLSTHEASAQGGPKKPKNDRKTALNGKKNKVKAAKIKSEAVTVYDAPNGIVSETGVKQVERSYDPEGNLLEETKFKRDGSVDRKLKNQYNAKGNIEKTDASQGNGGGIDHKNPAQISYSYDEQDNLVESTSLNEDGSLLVKTKNNYDANGKLTEMLTQNNETDPKRKLYIKLEMSYNEAGDVVKAVSRQADGSILSAIDYVYDSNGNIIEQVNQVQNKKLRLLNAYDAKGNMTETTQLNENGEVKSKTTNTYDDNGNNTGVEVDYPAANVKVKAVNTFDAKGNLTEQRTYNKLGALVSKSKYEYQYYE
ncbi:RHS repeat domain-containing protein [Hymenobacter crusticola]|uniref:Type IV secretion protein Rhs n=1 Tax=Hymenobacter crusticola TaxID=1770526 RepID=A0A243WGK5_9BACT|nr:hypothetical protein [Hymenobacter crusticola]OUJ74081.1 hypothetical protein BXP70_10080 [Hymenobacter crusticola]